MKDLTIKDEITEFIIYKAPNEEIKVEVFLHNETVWLTQKRMSELFDVGIPAISKHLDNIYSEGELDKDSTISILETVQKEGNREVKRKLEYYNLDVIIAVGYRVNSYRATQFRIWATKILKEYIIKGFAMDDKRLKNPNNVFGKDYFDEQLERIRDIRSSERRFYQKITDIYSQCSADYDSKSKITEEFFAIVQNKLHYAISGKTAAEIIYSRANSKEQNMGLTSWKNSPKGKIRKTDVSIAKNYLNNEELDSLNRIVSMYLDYAEMQAKKQNIMYMKDWVNKLNAFLKFNEREILQDLGKVTSEIAKEFAETEFEKYRIIQDRLFKSDFDKLIENSRDIK
ncbi:virulence RhuM family protein [Candidatus Woesearchaeota archaeon]|nr:virulence RhuM family protein [Candidatus Woesearchaeota archaeon]USN44924.1 MAG: virulence RhuM family protein [Candidatus Woesearchaeota archaeon]